MEMLKIPKYRLMKTQKLTTKLNIQKKYKKRLKTADPNTQSKDVQQNSRHMNENQPDKKQGRH